MKGGEGEPSGRGGRNRQADVHEQSRSNQTHTSTNDPDARIYRTAPISLGPDLRARVSNLGHGADGPSWSSELEKLTEISQRASTALAPALQSSALSRSEQVDVSAASDRRRYGSNPPPTKAHTAPSPTIAPAREIPSRSCPLSWFIQSISLFSILAQ